MDVQVPELDPSASEEATLDQFLDLAWAHRTKAVERGFSPEAAESMGVALHSGLIARYFTS